MKDSEKIIEVQKLLAKFNSGELSSYDFATSVENLIKYQFLDN